MPLTVSIIYRRFNDHFLGRPRLAGFPPQFTSSNCSRKGCLEISETHCTALVYFGTSAKEVMFSSLFVCLPAALCYVGTQLPLLKGAQPPIFGPCLLWPNGRPSQLLLSTCWVSCSTLRLIVIHSMDQLCDISNNVIIICRTTFLELCLVCMMSSDILNLFWENHWNGRRWKYDWLYGARYALPARVVQWSNHLGAMCSRAWRAQWPQSGVQSKPRPSKARPPTKK